MIGPGEEFHQRDAERQRHQGQRDLTVAHDRYPCPLTVIDAMSGVGPGPVRAGSLMHGSGTAAA
jgi:hypothetical protein